MDTKLSFLLITFIICKDKTQKRPMRSPCQCSGRSAFGKRKKPLLQRAAAPYDVFRPYVSTSRPYITQKYKKNGSANVWFRKILTPFLSVQAGGATNRACRFSSFTASVVMPLPCVRPGTFAAFFLYRVGSKNLFIYLCFVK